MKLLTMTPQNFIEAFMHYLCLRMQFRSTMLMEAPGHHGKANQVKNCR
ncbi:MAG: hypothetical protein OXU66_02225 [Gammaproteobacteria bacterium]|nr:hypothetical protein [Gammaproteobacteria bacterium]MDD9897259.1 hypothetical protein [Gammaproteobacteria bacterium]MDD9957734.1 hypothetical protein [Gammaproteobacteria bacterium]